MTPEPSALEIDFFVPVESIHQCPLESGTDTAYPAGLALHVGAPALALSAEVIAWEMVRSHVNKPELHAVIDDVAYALFVS